MPRRSTLSIVPLAISLLALLVVTQRSPKISEYLTFQVALTDIDTNKRTVKDRQIPAIGRNTRNVSLGTR